MSRRGEGGGFRADDFSVVDVDALTALAAVQGRPVVGKAAAEGAVGADGEGCEVRGVGGTEVI